MRRSGLCVTDHSYQVSFLIRSVLLRFPDAGTVRNIQKRVKKVCILFIRDKFQVLLLSVCPIYFST